MQYSWSIVVVVHSGNSVNDTSLDRRRFSTYFQSNRRMNAQLPRNVFTITLRSRFWVNATLFQLPPPLPPLHSVNIINIIPWILDGYTLFFHLIMPENTGFLSCLNKLNMYKCKIFAFSQRGLLIIFLHTESQFGLFSSLLH